MDIDALSAWNKSTGSKEIIVAVLDTGVDYTHPDLAGNMWINHGEVPDNGIDDDHNGYIDDYHGYDFVRNKSDPMDIDGHGTHCSGIVGAVGNNGVGVCGANWHVSIMPLTLIGLSETSFVSTAITAMLYADRMGARVLSCSFGIDEYSQTWQDVINASPAVVVCAAGNDNLDTDINPHYPSSYDCQNVISVASIDRSGSRSFFSNYGKKTVDLAAPGQEILSTFTSKRPDICGEYCEESGTSMATPYVSGVAGLILSVDPSLTNDEVVDLILATTDPLPSLQNITVTGGTLNAAKCLYYDISPSVTRIILSIGVNNHTLEIFLSGDAFLKGVTVNLTRSGYQNIAAQKIAITSPGSLTCLVPLNGATAGSWNVTVTNYDGRSGTLPHALSITDGQIIPPVVTGILPLSGVPGYPVTFTIMGSNFDHINTVILSRTGQDNLTCSGLVSGNNITGTFNLPLTMQPGLWNITVSQNGLFSSGIPFTVNEPDPAPVVTRVDPDFSYNSKMYLHAAITGDHFVNGTSVRLSHESDPNDRMENSTPIVVANATCLLGEFLSGWHTVGHYRVSVTNPDGQKGSAEDLFFLYDGISAAPVITGLSPASAPNNTLPVLSISGDYLDPPLHVLLLNESQEIVRENTSPVYDLSAGTVSASIDLHGLSVEEPYNIQVVNTTSEASSDNYRFFVDPPDNVVPSLDSITPDNGGAGSSNYFILSGRNIAVGSEINLTRPGRANISATDTTRYYGSDVWGYFIIPQDASPGLWNISIHQNGLYSNDNIQYLIRANPESVYTITATNGTGGIISPSGDIQVPIGTNQTFTVIPDPGCHPVAILVGGAPVGQVLTYTFSNVTDNHIIHAAFAKDLDRYSINATSDSWINLYPSGNSTYPQGTNQTYFSQPKPGADLSDLIVDSESKGVVNNWTFSDLNNDHSISAKGNATPGQVHVFFNATPRYGTMPLVVSFSSDQSLEIPTSWYWQFGDGATNTTQNPQHTYTVPGTYTVSLRATNN